LVFHLVSWSGLRNPLILYTMPIQLLDKVKILGFCFPHPWTSFPKTIPNITNVVLPF
jgi:hypothetical protein